jgi:hypothetical protein
VSDGGAAEIREQIESMYRALGDRVAFDRGLDAEITVWESADPRLLRGIAELNELRGPFVPEAERTSPVPHVVPTQIVSEAWGETGLIRYVLEVSAAPGEPVFERVRVTDVLRRGDDGAWRIVHHHAQDLVL